MDPIASSQADLAAAYAAAIASRAKTQQQVEGADAIRLVEAVRMDAQKGRSLPPDATFSLRI